MMDQHEDPKFDQWLKGAAKSYYSPRSTPREEIWKRIEDARRNKHVIELRPWMRWVVAAAAVLVIGIGIGRWTAHQPSAPSVTPVAATETDSTQPDVVYQVAATQYLSRAEAFLTGFRADAQGDAHSARFASQARDLLTTTQLMLDSPAAVRSHNDALRIGSGVPRSSVPSANGKVFHPDSAARVKRTELVHAPSRHDQPFSVSTEPIDERRKR